MFVSTRADNYAGDHVFSSVCFSAFQSKELKEQYLALKSACCACLTELILNDTNAQQIVQSNGIYSIGQLILPVNGSESVTNATQHLQVFF